MTPKQKKFVDEYLIDLNATEAALRAGYSKRTAYSIGNENLKKPEVQKAIQERMKDRERRTEIQQDKVLRELAHIAYDDIKNYLQFWTDDERKMQLELKSSEEIDTRNIAEIQLDNGKFKFKLYPKDNALIQLGRHLGLFNDKLNFDGTINLNVNVKVAGDAD
jgi:phage terminase small subunit